MPCRFDLNIRIFLRVVSTLMKNLFTIAVTAVLAVAFATSTFAGDNCGGCPWSGDKVKKDKSEKSEETTQS